jgi:hypothetical protein
LKSVEEGHHAGVDAEALKQKLKEAEQKQAEKKDEKPKDVFAPENWDTLLADEFDGGVGESYGVLLVSHFSPSCYATAIIRTSDTAIPISIMTEQIRCSAAAFSHRYETLGKANSTPHSSAIACIIPTYLPIRIHQSSYDTRVQEYINRFPWFS